MNHIILAVLWSVYCFLHSFFASLTIKQKIKMATGADFKWYRISYSLFAFLTLIALIIYEWLLPTCYMFPTNNVIKICGSIIGGCGLLLMIICIQKYFLSLSGIKSFFIESYSNSLLISGVHKYVRHPLYLGTFAFLWGLYLIIPYWSLFISNVVITVYTLYGIKLEEQKLITEFGEQYRKYQEKVPMILPSFKHLNA
ncbi:MAG TPA: isoprenylcysteine carboxylmethyltransferase family protein [Flavisolibacter sp.]|nr:isoprenylcysteine carboxylmethyltransferase family protein [Flavisolibacter sp.]